MTHRVDRRQALRLGGATGVVMLAGCLGGDGDDGLEAGDVPEYTAFLPDGQMTVFYGNIVAIEDAIGLEATDEEEQPDLDPVLEIAGTIASLATLGAAFPLSTFGLAETVPGESDEEGQDFTTEIQETVTVGDVLVAIGVINIDEVEQTVQSGGDGFQSEAEAAGVVGSYSLFETVGDSSGSSTIGDEEVDTIAVGENKLVLSSREAVEGAIEAMQGDRERATDTSDPFQWLVSTATGADGAFGGYDPEGFEPDDGDGNESDFLEEALDLVSDANGYLSSITFDDDTVEATMAAVFEESVSDDQRDAVDRMAGEDANDQSLTVDDNRVLLSATYDLSVLETDSQG
jgi:hypothetical protein